MLVRPLRERHRGGMSRLSDVTTRTPAGDMDGAGYRAALFARMSQGPQVAEASPSASAVVEAAASELPRSPSFHRGPDTELRGGKSRVLVLTFAAAIFLNAALLFAVQPMFTKMVLPLLGGSPAVWNTCLLFFQTALLGGYLYAHITSRLWRPKVQAAVHIGLLLIALALLPIHIPESWSRPAGMALPIPWLLGLLTISLGLPFFLLSAGAPMMQRWFSTTRHPAAENPYFLYAASNLGSFVALLAYPFVIEPRLPISQQSVSWLEFYYVLIVLIAGSAIAATLLRRRGDGITKTGDGRRETGEAVQTVDELQTAASLRSSELLPSPVSSLPSGVDVDDRGAVHVRRPGALRGSVRHIVEENPEAVDALYPPDPDSEAISEPSIVPDQHWRLRWVLLAFAPSSLLIGVTTYLSTDIASVPFLWVIPLAIYLLTFVLVFARRTIFNRRFMLFMQLVMALTLMVAICMGPGRNIILQASLHLVAFFATAMVCHRELADSRPRAEYLTEFYLWMSFGGVLGGVFNVILGPLLYDSLVEYPFALVVALGLRPSRSKQYGGRRGLILDLMLPALVGLAVWGGFRSPWPPSGWGSYGTHIFLGVAAVVVALFWKRPFRLALGAFAIYAGVRGADAMDSDVILQRRSFFGIYRVRQMLEYHLLQNGTTTHGGQSTQPDRRLEPITYYYRGGPMGQFFQHVAPTKLTRRVGIIGLGTGTTACYGRPGEHWTYYEIDPLVARIARTPALFTYIRDCPPSSDIVLGDARISLTRAADGEFDLLVLDAFSSDAIPAHLLTREALALYLRKLNDDGAVIFHISNRYVNLQPVLIALANDARVPGAFGDRDPSTEERGKLYYGSRWIVLAKKPSTLSELLQQYGWTPLPPEPAARVWTDDYTDLLGVLKWK